VGNTPFEERRAASKTLQVKDWHIMLLIAGFGAIAAFGFTSPQTRLKALEDTQAELVRTVSDHTTKIAVVSEDVSYIRQHIDEALRKGQ
jgi:hypothetical protein